VNSRERLNTFRAALWALVGATVVLFVFFAAVGGIDLAEATVMTVIVCVLAALWLVHFLRRRAIADDPRVNRADRERRGF
jgi:fatty acid desaturase